MQIDGWKMIDVPLKKSPLSKGTVLHFLVGTLPETKVAPENRPPEKEIPIGNHHF